MQQEIRDLIKSLEITNGKSKRIDCPSCGGTNTLGISVVAGAIRFNCFKSSCTVKGVEQLEGQSTKALLEFYKGPQKPPPFVVPDTFLNLDTYEYGISYLQRFPAAYTAYLRDKSTVKYDVKENRLVYIVRDFKGNIVDAIGRSFRKLGNPKWKRYGSSGLPFYYGSGCGVLCEDCISAAGLSTVSGFAGVALMGTSLHSGFASWVGNFDRAIVALDADASVKALSIAQKLNFYLPTKVMLLTRDLKMYTTAQLESMLEPYRE